MPFTNKLAIARLAFIALIACLALAPNIPIYAEKQGTRLPAVAGSFYPADPAELTRMIDGFLAAAKVRQVKEPVALIVPHAGYIYSGGVAAHSYAVLKGRKILRVVLIAPSHYEAFPFAAVYDGDAYATPLGSIPVDRQFAARLARGHLIKLSGRGHITSGPQGEHSVEVQLPILQRVLGDFSLVPVVMGDQSYDLSRELGIAISKLLKGSSDTIIIASSDLSHFHTYDQATNLDHKTLNAVEAWDYLTMSRSFRLGKWEACGGGPIIAAMIAAERLGANQAEVLKYANSGDIIGDRNRVVGYGAVVLERNTDVTSSATDFVLNQSDRTELLQIVRQSVEAAVNRTPYEPAISGSQALLQDRGVFVTVTKKGELAGVSVM